MMLIIFSLIVGFIIGFIWGGTYQWREINKTIGWYETELLNIKILERRQRDKKNVN